MSAVNRTAQFATDRPRTLATVRQRQQAERTIGDAVAAYDSELLKAVYWRWQTLNGGMVLPPRGKVVLNFKLHPDGRITDLTIAERDSDFLVAALCQGAVLDAAPYAPWPEELRRRIGVDHRRVTLTFRENDGKRFRPLVRQPAYDLVCDLPYQRFSPEYVPERGANTSSLELGYWPAFAWPFWHNDYDYSRYERWRPDWKSFSPTDVNWDKAASIGNAMLGSSGTSPPRPVPVPVR